MHEQPFGVTVAPHTVCVRGDVDVSVADQLIEAIRSCADDMEHRTLVVDMGAVTFIDSTGISALITCHKGLEGRGQELVIQNLPPAVRLTFSIAGVLRYLNVRSSVV